MLRGLHEAPSDIFFYRYDVFKSVIMFVQSVNGSKLLPNMKTSSVLVHNLLTVKIKFGTQ